jgi:hypothetical protein
MKLKKLLINLVLCGIIATIVTPTMIDANRNSNRTYGRSTAPSNSNSEWLSKMLFGSSWLGTFARLGGLVALGSALGFAYHRWYSPWNNKAVLDDIHKNFIADEKQGAKIKLMRWRFRANSQDCWTFITQIRAHKARVKELLLQEFHNLNIVDERGVVVAAGGAIGDAEKLQKLDITIDYELSSIKNALDKLAAIDSSLSSNPIERLIKQIKIPNTASTSNSFLGEINPSSPASWSENQENVIYEAMSADKKEQKWQRFEWLEKPFFRDTLFVFKYDKYPEAREYYWTLYKYRVRLEQIKDIVYEARLKFESTKNQLAPASANTSASAPSSSAAPAATSSVASGPQAPVYNIMDHPIIVNGNVGDGNTFASAGKPGKRVGSPEYVAHEDEINLAELEAFTDPKQPNKNERKPHSLAGQSTNGSRDRTKEDGKLDPKHGKKPVEPAPATSAPAPAASAAAAAASPVASSSTGSSSSSSSSSAAPSPSPAAAAAASSSSGSSSAT